MDLKPLPLPAPVLCCRKQPVLTVLVKALCGNSLGPLIWVALLWFHGLACVVYAHRDALSLTSPASPRAGWPLSHLPYRTGQITTRSDVSWPQLHVAQESRGSCSVLTLNAPPGPARTAALGALGPLAQNPFGSSKRQDSMCRKAPLWVWLAEGKVTRQVEAVFNPGRWSVPCCWQKLDGYALLEYLEAEKPLQGSGRTTVSKDSTTHWNVQFSRGYWEIPVENVGFILGLHCQVVAIMPNTMLATLLDVNVGGPSRNGNYVIIAKAVKI